MPGLSIRVSSGTAGPGRAERSVQVLPGPNPTVRAWHNGITHATVDLAEHGTLTLTGTPGDLQQLLERLYAAINDAAHVEFEASRDDRRDEHEGAEQFDQAVTP